jgi:hypothetical protein
VNLNKPTPPITCALAYSPDGSVLATSSNKSPNIIFIDPTSGTIRHTQPGSHPGLFSQLTFLGHHLISISKDLRVYNAVSGELLYALALSSAVVNVHLAANEADAAFAVVPILPRYMARDNGDDDDDKEMVRGGWRSQLMVFDLKNAGPVYRKILDGSVEVLLPLKGEGGYVLINDEAETLFLRRPGSAAISRRGVNLPVLEEARGTGLEDLFGKPVIEDGRDTRGHADESAQLQITHKTNSSLADVFNQSGNLPVRELFEQVVGVLVGAGEGKMLR